MKPTTATSTRRNDLRNLLDKFILTSRSQKIRVELADLIGAMYSVGDLSRDEFHSAMTEIA